MSFFQQIEIDSIKNAFKSKNLYFIWFIFLLVMFFSGNPSIEWICLIGLSFAFSLIFVVDLKEFIIPDSAQIIIFILANILILISPNFDFYLSYLGAIIAFSVFYSLHFFYEKIMHKTGLGLGDVKLFTNIGLLTGLLFFNVFLIILTIMSLSFLVIRQFSKDKNEHIPYGPFIVSSAWITILYQENLSYFIQNYINMIS